MKKVKLKNKDWLNEVGREFSHPAVVLWRSIELKTITESIGEGFILTPILDLGCGEGKIAKILFGKGVIDVGLDNEPEIVKTAKQSRVYKKVVLGDARNLPFKGKSFSTVFSNCVIEHIPGKIKVLREVKRVLKKNGIFIFTVPSKMFSEYLFFYNLFEAIGLKWLAKKYSQKRNQLLNHYHCENHQAWKNSLRSVGLTLAYHRYYLSKKTIMGWDFIAAVTLILDKLLIGKIFVNVCDRFAGINKLRSQIFYKIFSNKYYNSITQARRAQYNKETETGGGLLMIAKN